MRFRFSPCPDTGNEIVPVSSASVLLGARHSALERLPSPSREQIILYHDTLWRLSIRMAMLGGSKEWNEYLHMLGPE